LADLTISSVQLKQILAAKGLRYFALVALRFMYVSALSDALVEVLCWTTRTPYSFALLATVLGIEFIYIDLLHEFSVSLGGTCIGYVVVAPTVPARSDGGGGGGISMLPPNYIPASGIRSTEALNQMVQFFSRHLIVQFGADWSMQGLEKAELSKKLRLFFAQTTVEGPRYDTYLLFYCGPTTASGGEWALTDNQTLSLDDLLELWQDSQRTASSARLLIIADSLHSSLWLKPVNRLRADAVALQTHSVRKVDEFQIGLFTQQFCDYQSGLVTKMHPIRPSYSVSTLWTDFVFHMPSTMEVENYWLQMLPRCMHSCFTVIIRIASYRIQSAFCGCVLKRLRRLRMAIWPPSELDIGHGFKLVG